MKTDGSLDKLVAELIQISSEKGPRKPTPGQDPAKVLLPGTLECLDDEEGGVADIVMMELMKTTLSNGQKVGDLLLNRQLSNSKDGLNVMLELVAQTYQKYAAGTCTTISSV